MPDVRRKQNKKGYTKWQGPKDPFAWLWHISPNTLSFFLPNLPLDIDQNSLPSNTLHIKIKRERQKKQIVDCYRLIYFPWKRKQPVRSSMRGRAWSEWWRDWKEGYFESFSHRKTSPPLPLLVKIQDSHFVLEHQMFVPWFCVKVSLVFLIN